MSQPNQYTIGPQPRTWKDNYPTGRKHCIDCKRWRLVMDFPVRQWADEPECTIPRTLASVCTRCQAERKRRRDGYRPRNWYPHGHSGSARFRKYRNARDRALHAERRKDPAYVASINEYNRIWINAKAAERGEQRTAQGKPPPSARIKVDPKPFLRWLDGLMEPPWLSDTDKKLLNDWRDGTLATLERIDQIMTRAGAVDQLAILYPLEDAELSDAA